MSPKLANSRFACYRPKPIRKGRGSCQGHSDDVPSPRNAIRYRLPEKYLFGITLTFFNRTIVNKKEHIYHKCFSCLIWGGVLRIVPYLNKYISRKINFRFFKPKKFQNFFSSTKYLGIHVA